MKICRVLLLAFVSSLGGGGVLSAQTLGLSAVVGGAATEFAGVSKEGKLLILEGGVEKPAPEKVEWKLSGDVRTNAGLIYWTPRYQLFKAEDAASNGSASLTHRAQLHVLRLAAKNIARDWWDGEIDESWPVEECPNAVVIAAWVVNGRVAKTRVAAMPDKGQVSLTFELTEEEAAGQPALFLSSGGKFIPPKETIGRGLGADAIAATMLDDWEALQPVLAARPKETKRGAEGEPSLLHLAARAGAIKVVEGLLAIEGRKADQSDRSTPLHWAARNGRTPVVAALLKAGFKKNGRDEKDATAIFHAARQGHFETVKLLFDQKADLDAPNSEQQSAISEALNNGHVDILELLYGHTKFKVGDDSPTRGVLRTQAAEGHTEMVRWLLAKKISSTDGPRGSALAAAAGKGYHAIVADLLAAKADANWRDSQSGMSVILTAVSGDFHECVKLLLDAGADPRVANRDGFAALHIAALRDAEKSAEHLLAAGVEVGTLDERKRSPLDLAMAMQSMKVLAVLAEHGARIDVKSPKVGFLMEAALCGDNALLVKRALEDGWNADNVLQGAWPAVLVAEIFGAKACTEVLKTAGARMDARGPAAIAPAREVETRPSVISAPGPRDPRGRKESFKAQTVVVEGLVDAEGRILFPKIVQSPDRRLGMAILEALGAWRFSPALRGGVPVATKLKIPVRMAASTERIYKMSEVDELPKVITQVPPRYPMASRKAGEDARVVIQYVVNVEGKTEQLKVLEQSSEGCARAAVDAISKWIYRPATIDGKPVATELMIPVIFQIED